LGLTALAHFFQGSSTAGILPLLALPDERITGLDVTLDFPDR